MRQKIVDGVCAILDLQWCWYWGSQTQNQTAMDWANYWQQQSGSSRSHGWGAWIWKPKSSICLCMLRTKIALHVWNIGSAMVLMLKRNRYTQATLLWIGPSGARRTKRLQYCKQSAEWSRFGIVGSCCDWWRSNCLLLVVCRMWRCAIKLPFKKNIDPPENVLSLYIYNIIPYS